MGFNDALEPLREITDIQEIVWERLLQIGNFAQLDQNRIPGGPIFLSGNIAFSSLPYVMQM